MLADDLPVVPAGTPALPPNVNLDLERYAATGGRTSTSWARLPKLATYCGKRNKLARVRCVLYHPTPPLPPTPCPHPPAPTPLPRPHRRYRYAARAARARKLRFAGALYGGGMPCMSRTLCNTVPYTQRRMAWRHREMAFWRAMVQTHGLVGSAGGCRATGHHLHRRGHGRGGGRS